MEANVRILLLKIIQFNGDLTPLLKLGYEYSQITNFIRDEIKSNFAEVKNGDLSITELGAEFIANFDRENNRKDSSKWIEPEIFSKIPIYDLSEVYLPNQNELTF